MVSQITTGYPTDHNGRPYKRRRYRPLILVLVALLVLGIIVWAAALGRSDSSAAPTACNEPTPASGSASAPTSARPGMPAAASAAAPPTRTVVNRDQMISVTPAALSTFHVRVLNASAQRGAARSVSDDLTAQGFTPTPDSAYGDDTVYPNRDLNCVAQIRFGPAGKSAAAAVWLAIPCAELVNDSRPGTDVDVALGEYYKPKEQSQDAQAALEALRSADPKNPQTGADPGLVKAVHAQPC